MNTYGNRRGRATPTRPDGQPREWRSREDWEKFHAERLERARDKFTPPASLEDGERRYTELVGEQHKIQQQLGDRDRMVDGRRMESEEWWQWRKRAVGALNHLTAELRLLKMWLKEQRASRLSAPAAVDPADPDSLIQAAYALLSRLKNELAGDPESAFTDEEIGVVDALRTYLTHHARAESSPAR